MKLHIGSRATTPGWKTLDIQGGPGVDFVGSCLDLSRFSDASIETIYASHVLEHLGYQAALPNALKEWYRVLQPGGVLMVSVPDLDTLCRLFVHPKVDARGRFHLMRMMFGGQTDAHDFHYVGLTFAFLEEYLRSAGFQEIGKVEEFGVFDDTSSLRFGGVLISLNVRCRR